MQDVLLKKYIVQNIAFAGQAKTTKTTIIVHEATAQNAHWTDLKGILILTNSVVLFQVNFHF